MLMKRFFSKQNGARCALGVFAGLLLSQGIAARQYAAVNTRGSVPDKGHVKIIEETTDSGRMKLKDWLKELKNSLGIDVIYNADLVKDKKIAPLSKSTENIKSVEKLLQQLNLTLVSTAPKQYVLQPLQASVLPEERKTLTDIVNQAAVITEIKGTVTDEKGTPLQGVSIVLQRTRKGTVTNADGVFSINADKGDVLELSMVGYKLVTVTVQDNNILNISLQLEASNLGDVVVVGYGTQRKAQLIGSVAQLGGEKINNRTIPQISNALTGQMPGVTVIQRSGQPGASAGNIQIRGVGSFGSSTGAFILIDGIPASDFNQIDPNDIASISVLKDASSAAIYGARASNGVILVTTKSGSKTGKLKVCYNGYVGTQKVTALPQSVNSWEYAMGVNEAVPGTYTQAQIDKFKDGSDPDNYPNSDFYSEFFKSTALQTGHNISLANGNKNNQYVLSFGYISQDGIVIKNNYQRYNIRLNLVSDISSRLKLTTRIAGSYIMDKEPAPNATQDFNDMNTMIGQVVRYIPAYPIHLSNGEWGGGYTGKGTPVSMLNSQSFYRHKGIDLNGNLRLDYTPINDLKLSLIGGGYINYDNSRTFLATQRVAGVLWGPSSLAENTANSNYKTFQATADYTKRFGKHEISLLAGYSFEEFYSESLSAGRQDFPSNDLTTINMGSANGQTNNGSGTEWALQSLFGRFKYSYANRYLLEAVLRYDGSSRFPTTQKYGTFPALAIGWRISEESFLKNRFSWLNDLKLKASIGTLGNQNIGSNYPWQTLLSTGQGYNYSFGNSVNTGIARTTITDPTLHWESTTTKDLGLEFGLFRNQLSGSVTYFNKNTYDILVSPSGSVSNVLGFGVGVKNSGKLQNSGWEFTLEHKNKIGKLSYTVGANFTIINNKVIDVGVGNVMQPNGLVGNAGTPLFIGYPMNIYYGYLTDGLFTDANDAAAWPDQSALGSQKKPGDIRYLDISGPAGKPDGKIDPTYDRVVLGGTIPKYTMGLNLGMQYKGFDLNVLLQAVTGVQGYLSGYAGWGFYNHATIQRWQYDERWTTANPDRYAKYPRLEIVPNAGTGNTVNSSFWTLDGSYLRIKNIQLGYTVPASLIKKLGIESLRVTLAGENLATFSKYRKGWDPEINTGGGYYPILRNFTLGVNVIF